MKLTELIIEKDHVCLNHTDGSSFSVELSFAAEAGVRFTQRYHSQYLPHDDAVKYLEACLALLKDKDPSKDDLADEGEPDKTRKHRRSTSRRSRNEV